MIAKTTDELTAVCEILQRPGTEGAEYILRLPDGRTASVFDGEEDYWAIADAIDSAFPAPG